MRKTFRDKTLFLETLSSVTKWRDINVMKMLLLLSLDVIFYHQQPWYTSFHERNCTYLLFSMRKGNKKTEESYLLWKRLQCMFFLPSGCSNTESRIVLGFACNYKQNVCNLKSNRTSPKCLKHLFGIYLCCTCKWLLHLHSNKRSVTAVWDTTETALIHSTQTQTGDQPQAAGGLRLWFRSIRLSLFKFKKHWQFY